ncbi:hypothetical protein ACFVFQ_33760 [Streptomyces sp. NPDC057743]|uniref:hypothetical protein n=1 Tax=Streptomyces sp. NPDC057743 TaxID=3346236 RepID=UPI003692E2BE
MEEMSLLSGEERDSRAWVGPLVSTVVTLVGGFFALVFVGFSAMACDACSEGVAHRFDASVSTAVTVLKVGFLVPAALLLASWGVGWERRNAGRRTMFALAAPLSVVGVFVASMAVVQWP